MACRGWERLLLGMCAPFSLTVVSLKIVPYRNTNNSGAGCSPELGRARFPPISERARVASVTRYAVSYS
jgi:hypothetical protein